MQRLKYADVTETTGLLSDTEGEGEIQSRRDKKNGGDKKEKDTKKGEGENRMML